MRIGEDRGHSLHASRGLLVSKSFVSYDTAVTFPLTHLAHVANEWTTAAQRAKTNAQDRVELGADTGGFTKAQGKIRQLDFAARGQAEHSMW